MPQAPPPPPVSDSDPATGSSPSVVQQIVSLRAETARLRRLSLFGLAVGAIILGLATALVVTAARHGMPGFVPDVVESKEFVLRDREGRVRGVWGSDDEGAIRLVLQDAASATSVKLNLLDDGSAGLTFADSAGNARLVVALLPDETTTLLFADGQGFTRTVLSLAPSGASTLIFADQGGNTQSAVGVDGRGRPMLTVRGMTDQEGQAPPPEEP